MTQTICTFLGKKFRKIERKQYPDMGLKYKKKRGFYFGEFNTQVRKVIECFEYFK